ncbi:MAG: hypothetical protein E6767_10405 [Dysgonomonas sp.]|nr:hypothetical protein [Dysgonomonas sp.]
MEDLKRLKNRIDWFCENKVNAFSPTISPAPKSIERNEIESIYEGMRYFYERGIQEIVVEKKYMGSYCDIYLHKNLEDTYFASRNGHKINHIDLDAAIEACRDLHSRIDWTETAILIIQSELMPWCALGKGLIDNEFIGYLSTHQNHYAHLSQSDLYEKMAKVKATQAYMDYIEDRNILSTKEMREKYPHHIIRQYESLAAFGMLDLDIYKKSLDIYQAQIDHFGKDGDIHFKPFNILKRVLDDGSEIFVNDNLSYKEINDDEFLHLYIHNEEEFNQSVESVYKWFVTLEQNMEEGIVIKPRQAFIKNMPPAFKVRNNQYLTMIYGVNFHEQYDYYIMRRKIESKLNCSINDWMINWEMLKVKYKDINGENYLLRNLVFDRIMGERVESQLDGRL